jgi:hypothetical protein
VSDFQFFGLGDGSLPYERISDLGASAALFVARRVSGSEMGRRGRSGRGYRSCGLGEELGLNSPTGATKRSTALSKAKGKLPSPRPEKSKIRNEINFIFKNEPVPSGIAMSDLSTGTKKCRYLRIS